MSKRKENRKNIEFTEALSSDFIKLIESDDFRYPTILPNVDISMGEVNIFGAINKEDINSSFADLFKQISDDIKTTKKDE